VSGELAGGAGRRPDDDRPRCRGSTDTAPVSADPSASPDTAWTPHPPRVQR